MNTMNPFYSIVRVPSFVDYEGEKIETGKDVLINPETRTPIGTVSKNYKVVENKEVADVFDTAFMSYKKTIIDHVSGDTGKWKREIIMDDPEFTFPIDKNDNCKIKINVFNSYTGKHSVGFSVSAYRLICTNGMMGWENELSITFRHMSDNIIDVIKESFERKISSFWSKADIMREWNEIPFSKNDFIMFINTRDNMSKKMKNKYIELYPVIMNEFNENETKWGAYNVLTAIGTHYTKAHKGSNLFSAGYRRVEKLVDEFKEFDKEKCKNLLSM